MVNDTNTLNGALRELGETMAANLTEQGVPSTYDEGLTTLAGKILDIQGGGSSFDGISLTSDKDIISYYDEESATLTAQLLDGTSPAQVAGETVTFEVRKASDDSLVETLTADTDSSGEASVYYLGKGAGDLYIKCFSSDRMILAQTCEIQDIQKYIPSITKSSDYTSIYHSLYTLPNDITDVEITCTANSSIARGFGLVLGQTQSINDTYICRCGVKLDSKTFSSIALSSDNVVAGTDTYSANTDVSLKIVRESNTVKMYANDKLIQTGSNSSIPNYKEVFFRMWQENEQYTVVWKDIKIKAL